MFELLIETMPRHDLSFFRIYFVFPHFTPWQWIPCRLLIKKIVIIFHSISAIWSLLFTEISRGQSTLYLFDFIWNMALVLKNQHVMHFKIRRVCREPARSRSIQVSRHCFVRSWAQDTRAHRSNKDPATQCVWVGSAGRPRAPIQQKSFDVLIDWLRRDPAKRILTTSSE